MDDIVRLALHRNPLENTDFLRRIIAPVDGMGVTLSYVCRIATVSRWMTTFGGYRRDTETQQQ